MGALHGQGSASAIARLAASGSDAEALLDEAHAEMPWLPPGDLGLIELVLMQWRVEARRGRSPAWTARLLQDEGVWSWREQHASEGSRYGIVGQQATATAHAVRTGTRLVGNEAEAARAGLGQGDG